MRLAAALHLLVDLGAALRHPADPDVKVAVEEGGNITLPCSRGSKEDIERKVFDWKKDDSEEVFLYVSGSHYNNGRTGQNEQFKSRISHFEEELKNGNASITISNTRVADSGKYTCDFVVNGRPQRTSTLQLRVNRTLKDRSAENLPGASPKPVTAILDARDDGVPLKCSVEGASPVPELQWQDGEGTVLAAEEPQVSETGGRYSVTLLTTVTKTKTNMFRCVAKQQNIGHMTSAELYVPRKMFEVCELSCHHICGALGILLGGAATGLYFQKKSKSESPQNTPQLSEAEPINELCSQCHV